MAQKRRKALVEKETVRRLAVFLVKLAVFSLPIYAILLTGYQSALLMHLTTDISFWFLKATGMQAELVDGTIVIPVENGSWGAYVSWDSTGWKSALALLSLIFATDFTLRKKLMGLLLVPVVYAANILRIWFMFFAVSTYGIEAFPVLHLTVWSWGLVAVVLVLWVVWMKYVDAPHAQRTKGD
ncbi:MAG: exosortase/archaeosortase family protein [Candidatus Aenigmarchaeota archaeon]|nr:exosortase/archaeosortase family protein [Candidatus Aenigmarchaeota archaeon]